MDAAAADPHNHSHARTRSMAGGRAGLNGSGPPIDRASPDAAAVNQVRAELS
jgi:hypothetical protein